MNLKEGTRRLALLLGVVGAIAGGFVSYCELQNVREQQASHSRFEQLAASPVVQQARRSIETTCAQDPSDKQCGYEQYVPMSEVNGGGINTIYWSKDYQVEWIKTDDGQDLFRTTPAPSAWTYLWVALFWIVPGFFIPWGAVRAIGWVGAGFVAAPSLPESASVIDNDSPPQNTQERRTLVSRRSWILISILSLLGAIGNASKGGATGPEEFIPVVFGGFIGGLLLFGGGWALVVLIHRWINRRWINRNRPLA